MKINGHGKFEGPRKADRSDSAPRPAPKKSGSGSPSAKAPEDRVNISVSGKALSKLGQTPDMRAERLESVRAAMEDPEFLSPERVKSGIRKMLRDLPPEAGD